MSDLERIKSFHLKNSNGMEVEILNYGATIKSIRVPDKEDRFGDIVLGFDNPYDYLTEEHPYFGATIGRYANRISNARFQLNGEEIALSRNHGEHHIHGGFRGFDKRFWEVSKESGNSLVLALQSQHGDEGYPGNLTCQITFKLSESNQLQITYSAVSDRDTIFNPTNHTYFNLSAGVSPSVKQHLLQVRSDQITSVNEESIPSGDYEEVVGSPYDFIRPSEIGLKFGQWTGLDHNYVLSGQPNPDGLKTAAVLSDPASARRMTVLTTAPGVQVFTAAGFDGSIIGKGQVPYGPFCGICLETQYFPDSPNQRAFPKSILKKGEKMETKTTFVFDLMV